MNDTTSLEQSLNQLDEGLVVEQPEQEVPAPKTQPSNVDTNFRALREEKDRIKRERDELERRLREAEERRVQQRDPDDLVEARYVNDRLQQLEQRMSLKQVEMSLKYEHPDIDSVVTQENLERLSQANPTLASVINSSTDIYSKAKVAYEAIKKHILPDEDTMRNQDRIDKNMQKPRTATSVTAASNSPLKGATSFEGPLTEERKKAIWREMQEIKRRSY